MIIISAERDNYDIIQNARRSASMLNLLLDVVQWNGSVVPTIGCWDDKEEPCFCIQMRNDVFDADIERIAEEIKKLARRYHQVTLGGLDFENLSMSIIKLKTDEYNTWRMLESDEKPFNVNWVKIKDMYYYPGAEVLEIDIIDYYDFTEE